MNNAEQQSGSNNPITSQPMPGNPWNEPKQEPIVLPPPPSSTTANESTNLTQSYHSTYQ